LDSGFIFKVKLTERWVRDMKDGDVEDMSTEREICLLNDI
jgi:hypothetical protein